MQHKPMRDENGMEKKHFKRQSIYKMIRMEHTLTA